MLEAANGSTLRGTRHEERHHQRSITILEEQKAPILILITLFLAFATIATCFKPVVMMHGFAFSKNQGTARDFDEIKKRIQEHHSDTPLFALEAFEGRLSSRPLWEQMSSIASLINEIQRNNSDAFKGGWIGMGHSQA